MERFIRFALLLVCVLALWACTKAGTAETTTSAEAAQSAPAEAPAATDPTAQAATANPDVDPCTLLDKAAVAAAFGELKEGPSPSSGLRNEKQCNYTNMDGSWLKLSVYGTADDRWGWERGITNMQNPRDLSGLGDEAFTIKRGTDTVIYARKANAILEVSCSCPFEAADTIARAVVPKL